MAVDVEEKVLEGRIPAILQCNNGGWHSNTPCDAELRSKKEGFTFGAGLHQSRFGCQAIVLSFPHVLLRVLKVFFEVRLVSGEQLRVVVDHQQIFRIARLGSLSEIEAARNHRDPVDHE